jgi:hypothetical protein
MNADRKASRERDTGSRVTQGNKVTLTPEQEHFVGRLVEQGMARKWAIREVLDESLRDEA